MRAMLAKISVATALVLCLGQLSVAYAQTPTSAQRNALRQSCRADYEANCSSVPPGGMASLQCLQQHADALSPACRSAVGAVSGGGGRRSNAPAPAPARAPAPAPERPSEACRGDFREFCGYIRPGGGRVMMCLREHAAELSPGCQQALASLRR